MIDENKLLSMIESELDVFNKIIDKTNDDSKLYLLGMTMAYNKVVTFIVSNKEDS